MSEFSKKAFVFVLCGSKKHTDTLEFSYRALRRYTNYDIFIITDTVRNEKELIYDNVIDIKTPESLNNHQASIYLKTTLHKYLPEEYLYCYLDTDVVALSNDVNKVFDFFAGPITFATDHCRINSFSPSAVNCSCKLQFDVDNKVLHETLVFFDKELLPYYSYVDKCRDEINMLVAESKRRGIQYMMAILKYYMSGRFYCINERYKLDKLSGRWYDANDALLWYEHKDNIRYVEEQTGFKFDKKALQWYRSDGSSLHELTCNHLTEAIKHKTGVSIWPANWQHWNGGLFLFSRQSHSFLNDWHNLTLDVFNEPYWRTRDQGTLAATIWKYGLQAHITVPIQYNFIADYNREKTIYKGGLRFELDNMPNLIEPVFIHIYHHWANETWAVWRDVKKHLTI